MKAPSAPDRKKAPAAAPPGTAVRRCLLLHGHACDAETLELIVESTDWSGVAGLAFEFLDAPHTCKAVPSLYPGLFALGAMDEEGEYRHWGVRVTTDDDGDGQGHRTLQPDRERCARDINASIEEVQRALIRHAVGNTPIHGIGGVCDGSTIAYIVARLPAPPECERPPHAARLPPPP